MINNIRIELIVSWGDQSVRKETIVSEVDTMLHGSKKVLEMLDSILREIGEQAEINMYGEKVGVK